MSKKSKRLKAIELEENEWNPTHTPKGAIAMDISKLSVKSQHVLSISPRALTLTIRVNAYLVRHVIKRLILVPQNSRSGTKKTKGLLIKSPSIVKNIIKNGIKVKCTKEIWINLF